MISSIFSTSRRNTLYTDRNHVLQWTYQLNFQALKRPLRGNWEHSKISIPSNNSPLTFNPLSIAPFFSWTPQVQDAYSCGDVDDLELTCNTFTTCWSKIFYSSSRDYGHARTVWNLMGHSRLLQHTNKHLSPINRAYLKANDLYWEFKHMASGKTPCSDGLPRTY